MCDNDAVDYIQPNNRVSVIPSTPNEPDPDDDGSGVIAPVETLTPTTATTPPALKCKKITEYKDDRETINYRFIVTLYKDTNESFIKSFVEDLQAESNRPGSAMKINSIHILLFLKMIIVEMNMKAMEHVS